MPKNRTDYTDIDVTGRLLQETGDFLLAEDGSVLLLEGNLTTSYTDPTKPKTTYTAITKPRTTYQEEQSE